MIRADRVTVDFGQHRALSDVTLEVARGGVYGLIGPNGAGKTTLIRVLAGLQRASSGQVQWLDEAPQARSPRLGYLPQRVQLNRRATPREALRLFAALRGLAGDAVDAAIEHGGLSRDADRAIGVLSGGMRQRLALAVACLGDPPLLLLDEPSAGLDPRAAIELRERVRSLAASGRTVILSSHSLPELEAVCDSLALLVDGRVVAAGPVAGLKARIPGGSLDRLFLEAVS